MPRRLACHRLDNGEQVLGAMGEFAHQEPQMGLTLLALGNVDRGAGKPANCTSGFVQRLDMNVIPAHSGAEIDADFAVCRLALLKYFTLESDHRGPAVRRQNVLVSASKDFLYG